MSDEHTVTIYGAWFTAQPMYAPDPDKESFEGLFNYGVTELIEPIAPSRVDAEYEYKCTCGESFDTEDDAKAHLRGVASDR